jgi:hypothetical protein
LPATRSPPPSRAPAIPFSCSSASGFTAIASVGEYFQPWGVAELQTLGLFDMPTRAGGTVITRSVPYDETEEPTASEAAVAVPIDKVIPNTGAGSNAREPSAEAQSRLGRGQSWLARRVRWPSAAQLSGLSEIVQF